jgi:hypothetical protein
MESGIRRSSRRGIGAKIKRLRAWVRQLLHGDRYRPEEHYMRGPGPKTQKRRQAQSEARGE